MAAFLGLYADFVVSAEYRQIRFIVHTTFPDIALFSWVYIALTTLLYPSFFVIRDELQRKNIEGFLVYTDLFVGVWLLFLSLSKDMPCFPIVFSTLFLFRRPIGFRFFL